MNRWTPYKFKNGKETRNRIVVPPMASQTASSEGFVTEKTKAHYQNLGRSQAGLIFVEYSFVHPTGRGEPNQLGASRYEQTAGLKQLADIIHQSGALAFLQIVHNGGKSQTSLTGEALWGSSAISIPIVGGTLERPREISEDEVSSLIDWYVQAAKRTSAAGFDGVELHAAHGYGLNQWLSPITNKRTDIYGGTPKKRAQLLNTLVSKVKFECPELLLSVRLAAQDNLPGGLTINETGVLIRNLEELGLDIVNVSSGIGGWRRPKSSRGQGYLVEDARYIKEHTTVPVIGVGGISEGTYIDSLLASKDIDFTAVGRAILAGPEKWGKEHLSQRV